MIRIFATVSLLICSNIFMTAAWYGHLKWFKPEGRSVLALLGIVLVSWLIALPEYMLQVPGNRLGHLAHGGHFTTPQLKILQEAITLVVFSAFSLLVLKDKLRVNDLIAFALVFLAVVVAMMGRGKGPA